MLALSSLSKSSRYVGILYAAVIFFTQAIYGVLYAVTRSTSLSWISFAANLDAGRRRHLPPAAAVRHAVAGVAADDRRPDRAVRRRSSSAGCAASRWSRDGATAIVAAEHLSKWYGQVIGLNDVSVTVPPGITGLLGPNGAGKSTFMKLITGQLKPSKGTHHRARRADLAATRRCTSASASVPSRTPSTSG